MASRVFLRYVLVGRKDGRARLILAIVFRVQHCQILHYRPHHRLHDVDRVTREPSSCEPGLARHQ